MVSAGSPATPTGWGEFRDGVHQALAFAAVLKPPQMNALVGIAPAGVSEADARRTLVDNLTFAAHALGERGIRLLMEPINTFDIPGFFVNRTG